jgi:hypothetical protein
MPASPRLPECVAFMRNWSPAGGNLACSRSSGRFRRRQRWRGQRRAERRVGRALRPGCWRWGWTSLSARLQEAEVVGAVMRLASRLQEATSGKRSFPATSACELRSATKLSTTHASTGTCRCPWLLAGCSKCTARAHVQSHVLLHPCCFVTTHLRCERGDRAPEIKSVRPGAVVEGCSWKLSVDRRGLPLGTVISRSSVLVLQGAHDLLRPLPSPLWPGGDAVVVDIKQTGLHTVQLPAWTAPSGPGVYRAAWSLLLGGCQQCDAPHGLS